MIRNYPVTYRVDTEREIIALVVGHEVISQIPLDGDKTTLEDLRALLGIRVES